MKYKISNIVINGKIPKKLILKGDGIYCLKYKIILDRLNKKGNKIKIVFSIWNNGFFIASEFNSKKEIKESLDKFNKMLIEKRRIK